MLEAIEALSALGIALIGSFLLFWVVIGFVVVSMWLIPFSVLCLYEVLAMWRDVFAGLMRPFVWLANLIGKRHDQNHQQFSVRRSDLFNNGGCVIPRLPGRGGDRGRGDQVARSVLRL